MRVYIQRRVIKALLKNKMNNNNDRAQDKA